VLLFESFMQTGLTGKFENIPVSPGFLMAILSG
jgi:hypothetical protein